jgi:hypothetical protein
MKCFFGANQLVAALHLYQYMTSREAEFFDLWTRGDPLRLWAESLGHSSSKNLPQFTDIWGYITRWVGGWWAKE